MHVRPIDYLIIWSVGTQSRVTSLPPLEPYQPHNKGQVPVDCFREIAREQLDNLGFLWEKEDVGEGGPVSGNQ